MSPKSRRLAGVELNRCVLALSIAYPTFDLNKIAVSSLAHVAEPIATSVPFGASTLSLVHEFARFRNIFGSSVSLSCLYADGAAKPSLPSTMFNRPRPCEPRAFEGVAEISANIVQLLRQVFDDSHPGS